MTVLVRLMLGDVTNTNVQSVIRSLYNVIARQMLPHPTERVSIGIGNKKQLFKHQDLEIFDLKLRKND